MGALSIALVLALAPQAQLGPYHEAGAPLTAPGRLWVVDDLGVGADFTKVQEAIDAARSGDAIEVRSGTYRGFVWEGKDLVLFGSGSQPPRIQSQVVIRSIGAGNGAVVRNLDFEWNFLTNNALFLSLEDSPGTIWLEDCTVTGGTIQLDMIQARDCENVVVQRCSSKGTFSGFNLGPPSTKARFGMRALRSTVHAYESVFWGPPGYWVPNGQTLLDPPANQKGGNGFVLEDSTLFASGCEFRGGSPGFLLGFCGGPLQGCTYVCLPAEPGGTGLVVSGSSQVESLDSVLIAGPARPSSQFICCSTQTICFGGGPAGLPSSGPVTTIPLPARTYRVDGPSVAGGSYHLTAKGQPGEFLFSVFSERPAGTPFPIYFGTQLTANPTTFVDEGPIPASGVLEKDVRVPPLMLAEPFEVRFAQGLMFDALANAYLTSGSVLIVR